MKELYLILQIKIHRISCSVQKYSSGGNIKKFHFKPTVEKTLPWLAPHVKATFSNHTRTVMTAVI